MCISTGLDSRPALTPHSLRNMTRSTAAIPANSIAGAAAVFISPETKQIARHIAQSSPVQLWHSPITGPMHKTRRQTDRITARTLKKRFFILTPPFIIFPIILLPAPLFVNHHKKHWPKSVIFYYNNIFISKLELYLQYSML